MQPVVQAVVQRVASCIRGLTHLIPRYTCIFLTPVYVAVKLWIHLFRLITILLGDLIKLGLLNFLIISRNNWKCSSSSHDFTDGNVISRNQITSSIDESYHAAKYSISSISCIVAI